jgi:hypothetical protein
VVDCAGLLGRARAGGWTVTLLDLRLDLASPHDEFVAHVPPAFAQLERRLISQRPGTRRPPPAKGVVTERRPLPLPASTAQRVVHLHAEGLNLTAIARAPTSEGVPLTSGTAGLWQPVQVRRVLERTEVPDASAVDRYLLRDPAQWYRARSSTPSPVRARSSCTRPASWFAPSPRFPRFVRNVDSKKKKTGRRTVGLSFLLLP